MEAADARLIERIAAGDEPALKALYARHGQSLLRFAMSILHDREAAEDAVQETLLAAWRSAATFGGESRVSTWLFGICRNKALDIQRARARAGEPLETAEAAVGGSTGEVEFWECFRGLSGEQQQLLSLVFLEGRSQADVAEIIGIPLGTVKSRVHTARKHLSELLTGGD